LVILARAGTFGERPARTFLVVTNVTTRRTTMRLKLGTTAPSFTGTSLSGRTVSLDQYAGRKILLKFYRFASCPICTLHLREFIRRFNEVRATGMTPLVVFHSPKAKIEEKYQPGLPFEIVADPSKVAFKAYGVESSLGGMFTWDVMRDYARAMAQGIFSKPFGHEGGIQGHPADFIIDESGTIVHARYGRNYADTLTVDGVLAVARADIWRVPEPATRPVTA
jgi:peroxiredoxin